MNKKIYNARNTTNNANKNLYKYKIYPTIVSDKFTYDQLANWTFKDLYELNKSPVWSDLQNQNKNQNIGPVTIALQIKKYKK